AAARARGRAARRRSGAPLVPRPITLPGPGPRPGEDRPDDEETQDDDREHPPSAPHGGGLCHGLGRADSAMANATWCRSATKPDRMAARSSSGARRTADGWIVASTQGARLDSMSLP